MTIISKMVGDRNWVAVQNL